MVVSESLNVRYASPHTGASSGLIGRKVYQYGALD